MIDDKGLALAKEKILRISQKRVKDLGYNLCLATTLDNSKEGIAAIVFGGKVNHMTEEDRLTLEVNIPEGVTINNENHTVKNPSYIVRISYIKK